VLEDTAKKVTNKSNSIYGLVFTTQEPYHSNSFITDYGGYVVKYANGKLDDTDIGLENDGSVKGVTYIQALGKMSIMPDGVLDPTSMLARNVDGFNIALIRWPDGEASASYVRELAVALRTAAGRGAGPIILCVCPPSAAAPEKVLAAELDGQAGVHLVTPGEILDFYGRLYGLSGRRLRARVCAVLAAWKLNPLCFLLSPIALAWIFFYSLTKRFTRYAHLVLGLGLAIAPVGGFLGVAGHWSSRWWMLCALALAVAPWVGGFDILYALPDVEFDRANR